MIRASCIEQARAGLVPYSGGVGAAGVREAATEKPPLTFGLPRRLSQVPHSEERDTRPHWVPTPLVVQGSAHNQTKHSARYSARGTWSGLRHSGLVEIPEVSRRREHL